MIDDARALAQLNADTLFAAGANNDAARATVVYMEWAITHVDSVLAFLHRRRPTVTTYAEAGQLGGLLGDVMQALHHGSRKAAISAAVNSATYPATSLDHAYASFEHAVEAADLAGDLWVHSGRCYVDAYLP
jgi:hypothetical protein